MEDVRKLGEVRKPLILHHWDADGICSAAMISGFLGDLPVKTMVPRIGMYSLSETELRDIASGNHDGIVVADLALPERDYDRLVSPDNDIWVFDHHQKERRDDLHQFNPVARGSSSDDYPSTTWVLHECLRTPVDLLTILGAIGDKEEGIRQSSRYNAIREHMESAGVGLEEMLRICELIDSNYRVGDVDAIGEAVSFLTKHENDPGAMLTNETWMRNCRKVSERIVAEEHTAGSPVGGILIHRFSSDFDIVSAVSRRLSKMNEVRVSIVVQTGFFTDYDRIYVRTNDSKLDLGPILDLAMGRGHVSGGKREVVGALVPPENTEEFLGEMLRLLEAT